jgi:hypothetical protein
MPIFVIDELERLDAPLSVFFTRQLELVRPQVETIVYPELMGRTLVPVDNSIPNGVESITRRVYDKVGRARWVRDDADDFPRVDVFGFERTWYFKSFGDSYGWNVQELRNSQQAGAGLDTARATAAREAIELFFDDALLVGDPEVNILGLFTQPITGLGSVLTLAPATVGGDTFWADKIAGTVGDPNPGSVLRDLHSLSFKPYQNSNRVERVDTLVLPTSLYGPLITERDDINGATLMSIFLANDPYIQNVFQSEKLETASATGGPRVVAYRRDPSILQGLIPQEFEQFPPQWENLKVRTLCQGRTGGTAVYRPKSIIYMDGAGPVPS